MSLRKHHKKEGSGNRDKPIEAPQEKQPEPIAESPREEVATRLTKTQLKNIFLQMKNENWVIRASAVEKLGKIIDKVKHEFRDEIIDNLGKVIHDKPPVSEAAIEVLVSVGRRAVPMIIKGLKSDNYWIVSSSMRALGKMGEDAEESVKELRTLLHNKDEWIKYGAIEALGKIGEKAQSTLPQLRNMATYHEDPAIRVFSKIAIERITGECPNDISEWKPSSD